MQLEDILEAHPIKNNEDLLQFNIRSLLISWRNLISPINKRGKSRYFVSEFNNIENYGEINEDRNEVLVCHDMMNNYRVDKYYSSGKKWDDYRFYHWSGIDYFCYFTHNYVSIPPSGWINAAHLNGVRILGTYLVEHLSGTSLFQEVLKSYESAFSIADALLRICQHFCFDGWFLNIERDVERSKVPLLKYFIRSLTQKIHENIPNGVVIWYDSVIQNGSVRWQNELNSNNVDFLELCDGIFINYNWNELQLRKTVNFANSSKIKLSKIFFGLDVFGRGQTGRMQSYKTLRNITKYNFSVGIFAPGWTFESIGLLKNMDINSFDGLEIVNKLFLIRNSHFWKLLWPNLSTHSIQTLPFYTDFCLGSGKYTFEYGLRSNTKFFNLFKQAIQPSVPLFGYCKYYFEDAVFNGSCLQIIRYNEMFRLFATNFFIENAIIFSYVTKVINSNCGDIECILKLYNLNKDKSCELICGNFNHVQYLPNEILLNQISDKNMMFLNQILENENLQLKIPLTLSNNWTVRYFIVKFDQPVFIEDIGICFRTNDNYDSFQIGLLGAMQLCNVKLSMPNFVEEISVSNYLQ